MQSETLKPCPKCGNIAQSRTSSDGEVEWYRCRKCPYESKPHYDRAKAIAAWNNRAVPAPPAESAGLVERLRGKKFLSTRNQVALQHEAAHHIAAQDAEIARKDAALEKCLALIDDMGRFVSSAALRNYALFNEASIAARSTLNPETGHG